MAELGDRNGGLWIAPTPLASRQLTSVLANGRHQSAFPRVLCWDELWRWVRRESDSGPSWLSHAAALTVLQEALSRSTHQRAGKPLERVAKLSGYRRQLWEKIQAWTIIERPARVSDRSLPEDPLHAAEQVVYSQYRRLLKNLDSEDDAGASVWASKRLESTTGLWKSMAGGGPVVVFGYNRPSPARWRLVNRAMKLGHEVHVGLQFDAEPSTIEAYLGVEPTREQLLRMGFVETRLDPPHDRPAGLSGVERAVFAVGPGLDGSVTRTEGLRIEGGPQGDGTSRIVCRAIRELRGRGVPAGEILVLFPRWTAEAELMLETLRSWSIPAEADIPSPLRREPAVAALRLVMSIPRKDAEIDQLTRLLRHGQFRPNWPGVDSLELATAAMTVHATQVFRGKNSLLRALERLLHRKDAKPRDIERVESARRIVERMFQILDPLDTLRTWQSHSRELQRVVQELGIGEGEENTLEPLWEALDDREDILRKLGLGEAPREWADFVAEVESILSELPAKPRPSRADCVRLATVEQAEGVRAEHVILADLVEGSFPARSVVRPFLTVRTGELPDPERLRLFAGEMESFLAVLGSARTEVLLVYPTTDAKGQELLRAGFLDDVLARLSESANRTCHQSITRLHPALVDHPELAGSPGDARVRATALASERGDSDELARLSASPAHRRVLGGTAVALHALGHRLRGTPFSEYEGLLRDGAAVLMIDEEFGPDFRFSASQLETYLACPFHFFSKYVLKLAAIEDRDELGEDLTERGSQLHDILENFEQLLRENPDELTLEQIAEIEVSRTLDREPAGATELDLGLWEIERNRIQRTIGQYLVQRRAYQRDGVLPFIPVKLEFDFGTNDAEHPVLELSRGSRRVLLRGRIDRIDVAQTDEGWRFRVIDYKSGKSPTTADVRQGAMLQLPLYAMAVQRMLYPQGEASLFDLGYWSLKDNGYRSIVFSSWEEDQVTLVEHVLSLVDRLRRGEFMVHSRKEGCENYCEFREVCRIRQVRRAGKSHELSLPALSAKATRRKSSTPSAAGESS